MSARATAGHHGYNDSLQRSQQVPTGYHGSEQITIGHSSSPRVTTGHYWWPHGSQHTASWVTTGHSNKSQLTTYWNDIWAKTGIKHGKNYRRCNFVPCFVFKQVTPWQLTEGSCRQWPRKLILCSPAYNSHPVICIKTNKIVQNIFFARSKTS